MQTRQNVEKMAKCGNFFSGARGNAKLMINFFCLKFFRNLFKLLRRCPFTAVISSRFNVWTVLKSVKCQAISILAYMNVFLSTIGQDMLRAPYLSRTFTALTRTPWELIGVGYFKKSLVRH